LNGQPAASSYSSPARSRTLHLVTTAHHSPPRKALGFTLTEVLVVIAIIAILALIAVPSMQERIVREQVVEAAKLADEVVKGQITKYWQANTEMPVDNEAAEVPAPDKIVGNFVSSITVEDGAVHIVFGNNANGSIKGRTLTLRPAVVADTPKVPPAWVCAFGNVPEQMTAQGRDRTDVENRYLPVNCRRLSQ
jgi:type IV pilus assembly protein PilA